MPAHPAAHAARLATTALGAAMGLLVAAAPVAAQETPAPMFPLLTERAAEFAELTIEARRFAVTLALRDGAWVDASRGDYPVLAERALAVLAEITAFQRVVVATNEPGRYGFYDVQAPSPNEEDVHIRALAQNGDVLADAMIGAAVTIPDPPRAGTAIRNMDEAEVWLATGAVTLPRNLSGWFDTVVRIPGRDLSRIVMSDGDHLLVDAIKADFATGTYAITNIDPALLPPNTPAEGIPADDNSLRSLGQAVVGVRFEDATLRTNITVPEDARIVRFETVAGVAVDVTVAPNGELTWVLFDATALPTATPEGVAEVAALVTRTDRWAFLLQDIAVAALQRSPLELYIPPPVDFAAPPM